MRWCTSRTSASRCCCRRPARRRSISFLPGHILDDSDLAGDGALLIAQNRADRVCPEYLAVLAQVTLVEREFVQTAGVRIDHDAQRFGSVVGMRKIEWGHLRELFRAIAAHAYPGGIDHGEAPVSPDYHNPHRDTLENAPATRLAFKQGKLQALARGDVLCRAHQSGHRPIRALDHIAFYKHDALAGIGR